ncbi:MAG: ferrous iron transport protein B [Clostridiaceae bacterium]
MIIAALLGNPNVGKTTLFNKLTGSNQKVGNWAGVTVDRKEGFINNEVKIVDLPGIYAMDTFSNEEKVSKNFLKTENVDVIVNIVDASNLNRNLYLTYQLKEFNKPIILVINMMDVAKNKGININVEKLEKLLKVKVIPVSASKGENISQLINEIKTKDYSSYIDTKAYKFKNEKETYGYIESILTQCISTKYNAVSSFTNNLDKIFLNKFLAYPIFFLLLFTIFKFTFSWVGQPIADLLDGFVADTLTPYVGDTLLANSSDWFRSLIVDGIIGGVGSVIVFLPVILALFLGISILEDSGYMARAAFIMDKGMRKMGLSGKAFIPLIIAFGCSVPAVMSARTLESEKDRKLTALLVPLMSCNARLPVYALFASVFFPGRETTVVFSLYLLGIAIAFAIGLIFKNTIFKKDEEPFIIELPEYQVPEVKMLLMHTWEKGKGFVKKAGTIIFSVSVIIWLLSNFNTSGYVGIDNINQSFLAAVGSFIAPLFAPMGFGTWETAVSIITGLLAKEVVVGTMGVIYGTDLEGQIALAFSSISAYAFLVFVLLYTPCVSVVAAMRKEYGTKMAIFSVSYQFVLAWVISLLAYLVGNAMF